MESSSAAKSDLGKFVPSWQVHSQYVTGATDAFTKATSLYQA